MDVLEHEVQRHLPLAAGAVADVKQSGEGNHENDALINGCARKRDESGPDFAPVFPDAQVKNIVICGACSLFLQVLKKVL